MLSQKNSMATLYNTFSYTYLPILTY